MKAMPVTRAAAEAMGLREFPGYQGMFTTAEYENAWPNGSRVIKANSDPCDATKNDERGTIRGSIGNPELGAMYFIEWDYRPGAVIGCMQGKLRREWS